MLTFYTDTVCLGGAYLGGDDLFGWQPLRAKPMLNRAEVCDGKTMTFILGRLFDASSLYQRLLTGEENNDRSSGC